MKKIFLTLVTCISIPCFADVPNTFVSGDIATAEAFNQNFQSLDSRVNSLEAEAINIKAQVDSLESNSNNSGEGGSTSATATDGYITASVNGTPMKVHSSTIGYYSVITPTGFTLLVDVEGYPTSSTVYFENSDCVGQPYSGQHAIRAEHTRGKPIGYVFANPLISSLTDLALVGGSVYYTQKSELIKLNYKSMLSGENCHNSNGLAAVFKMLPNNKEVTGIESFPLVISGVGSPLIISEEVGEPTTGSFNVYAGGVKIGTTDYHPNRSSGFDAVRVKLDGYSNKTVTLYKDGTYIGGDFSSNKHLYYTDASCSGTAYVEVLSNGVTHWWSQDQLGTQIVNNNGNYHSLSEQVYRPSTTAGSRKSYSDGSCYKSSTVLNANGGYKVASLTDAPNIPVFSLPITIEGYTEPTPINSLPVMD